MAWIMVVTAQFCVYFSLMSLYNSYSVRSVLISPDIDISSCVVIQSYVSLWETPIVWNLDINDYYHNVGFPSTLYAMVSGEFPVKYPMLHLAFSRFSNFEFGRNTSA